MAKTFKRVIENFTCKKCGNEVRGNGYTNHCSKCLWSLHVDIHPGDRAATCGGLMEPVRVVRKKDAYVITHRCITCGHEKNNTVSDADDMEALVQAVRDLNAR